MNRDSEPSETGVDQESVFDALSSSRRRYVLWMLNKEGDSELTEIAERLAAWEEDIDIEEVSYDQRKRLYISLYQTHIPKLEEIGFVSFDPDSGRVELHDSFSEIEPYLDPSGQPIPWQYLYAPLAVVVAVYIGLWAFDMLFFVDGSSVELLLIIFTALGLTIGIHGVLWYLNRSALARAPTYT